MLHRSLPILLAVLALACFVCQPAVADDKGALTHEGKVVSAAAGKLTMTDKDGKNQHTHAVTPTTKITCDGKECKLEDLKKDVTVKVTYKNDAEKTAAKIEAKTKAS
jgi:hypothetical protein